MPSTADTDTSSGELVVTSEQPFSKLGHAVLERLRIPTTDDAELVVKLGQAATCVYYLRTLATGDRAEEIKRHLRGEPKAADDDDVEAGIAGTAWLLNRAVNKSAQPRTAFELAQMLTTATVHLYNLASNSLETSTASLEARVDDLLAAGVPAIPEAREPDVAAVQVIEAEDEVADVVVVAELAEPEPQPKVRQRRVGDVGEVPPKARRRAAKVARAVSDRPTAAAKGAPTVTPPAKVVQIDSIRQRSGQSSGTVPEPKPSEPRPVAVERISAEATPYLYQTMSVVAAFEGLMIISASYNRERAAIVELISGARLGSSDSSDLAKGVRAMRRHFEAYIRAAPAEVLGHPTIRTGFAVARNLLGIDGGIHSLSDATRMATRPDQTVGQTEEAFRDFTQRVLRHAISLDPASEPDVRQKILELRGAGLLAGVRAARLRVV